MDEPIGMGQKWYGLTGWLSCVTLYMISSPCYVRLPQKINPVSKALKTPSPNLSTFFIVSYTPYQKI